MKGFWEQEELPSCSLPLTGAEQHCEEHFTRTRQADGRYSRLPTSPALPITSSTRGVAIRVLRHMKHRFKADADLEKKYVHFMSTRTLAT